MSGKGGALIGLYGQPEARERVLREALDLPVRIEAAPGHYTLGVKHRNHLAVTSRAPVAYTNALVAYDFTPGSGQYDGGTNAATELSPGVWGVIAGDADGDGRITDVDRQIVSNQLGMTGYLAGDLNLDGVVTAADLP